MHVIGRIRVMARAGGESLARKVDRCLADRLDTELPERLGECFERIAAGRTLRFDTLEIDLGRIAWADFEKEFCKRVAAALASRIGGVGSSAEMAGDVLLAHAEISKATRSPSAEVLEAWLFFLRRGHLPWWFSQSRWEEIESARVVRAAAPDRFHAALREFLREFPTALVRLASLMDAREAAAVFPVAEDDPSPAAVPDGVSAARETLAVLIAWLARQPGGVGIVTRFAASRGDRERMGIRDWLSRISSDSMPVPSSIAPAEETADECLKARSVKVGENRDEATNTDSITEKPDQGPDDDRIAVQNAGLVLLHPFIGRLFKHLGWLDAAGGIDPEWRWHAVQALQQLAQRRHGLPEPTLVLEKTLCGIPLHHPAEFPQLEPEKVAECEDLLVAVIGHWSVLGRTSPEGLREAFLMRDGLLDFSGDEIRLSVERRSYDLLLGKLPWPLDLVKLPWMKRLIRVRWHGDSRP